MALKRVLLRFPTDFEIRYLERPPRRGEKMSSARGDKYIVSGVTRDNVICVPPGEYRDAEANRRRKAA